MFMKRRKPQVPACVGFLRRPMHLVIGGIGFDGAGLQIAWLGMNIAEAPDIELPKVHAGIVMQNHVGHRQTRPAGGGNPRRKPASHVKIVQFWRQTHDRLAIRGNRNGAIDNSLNSCFVQDRQPFRRRQRK